MDPEKLLARQREFFLSNKTKDLAFRIEQLAKLENLIRKNEEALFEAIYADFGKSSFETYLTELSQIYHELKLARKNARRWAKTKRVRTNLANLPGQSFIMPEPLGCSLVIGAWNYPLQLCLIPVVSALAAGNTVILKPSELSGHSSKKLADLLNAHFPENYLFVYEGGVDETTALLNLHFDKIFFTGSIPVGRIVYEAAAKQLTPVTLELGGKSPTFVLSDCRIGLSAKRIVWAKFLNAGQTCVAPDYILVDRTIADEFTEALIREIKGLFPPGNALPENYVRIINDRHFERLRSLIEEDSLHYGGELDPEGRIIWPTVLYPADFKIKAMQDEIFGPILPIIPYDNLDQALETVRLKPKPLSAYIFTEQRKEAKRILTMLSFGGGAVNESLTHLTNNRLPFGGVGFSGTGSYHGESGFREFSHYKSILKKSTWFEAPMKYPPYTQKKLKAFRRFLE